MTRGFINLARHAEILTTPFVIHWEFHKTVTKLLDFVFFLVVILLLWQLYTWGDIMRHHCEIRTCSTSCPTGSVVATYTLRSTHLLQCSGHQLLALFGHLLNWCVKEPSGVRDAKMWRCKMPHVLSRFYLVLGGVFMVL